MTSRLVIAPNWIGDAVMSLPVLRALRRHSPGARLIVLARRGPAAIYRADGSADSVRIRGSFLADVFAARAERVDEAWMLPHSMRAALLGVASGARRRLGYATDRRAALLTDALPPPPATLPQLRDYDPLLLRAGVAPDEEPPRLPIPPEAAERARAVLASAGVRDSAVVLCPGSATSPTKRWPIERFAELADRLALSGIPCLVAVGPAERELGASVAQAGRGPRPLPLPIVGPDLDPVELAAVFAQARVVVSNDSGPAHLSAAVGTPTLVFFGPTDPGRTAPTPAGAPVRVLDRYVFCSPCFLETCPYGHECMTEITVEDARSAVEELLG